MPFRRSWAFNLVEQLSLRISDHIDVDGIWVGVFAEPDNDTILGKLRDSLALIDEYDPYRYRLVRAEIYRIWANLLPGDRTEWVAEDKRCIVDPRIARSEPIEQIAATIIHEAVQARFSRCGVIGTDYVRRQQIDKACLRQEVAFATRLPDGAGLARWIEVRQARPADFWADRSQRERYAVGEVEVAEYAQVPDWVLRIAFALRCFRAWMRS